MLDNILNLEGVAVLNKKQQLLIEGGSGSCAYYDGETGDITYNISASQAEGALTNASDHWCCDNCSTASWYGGIGVE